jgi:methylenetetrahydrofolate dehydrogenase (NADP+)/methenyltetrahydrofolate cyclohydrolase
MGGALRLEGKAVAIRIHADLREEVHEIITRRHIQPTLAVVLVGQDPASHIYVGRKRQAAVDVGIRAHDYIFPDGLSETCLLSLIDKLNDDDDIHGILVQLPLPRGISEARVLDAIAPDKDVDGFHPENLGRLMLPDPAVVPCTPAGVMAILDYYELETSGKIAVVIGRSRIVGRPVAQLLLARDATVIMAHRLTRELASMTLQADILIAAAGHPHLIGLQHVKPGSIVVDVGINRLANGRLIGDVDFDAVSNVATAITPVPGGVGPTTVAMLMRNTIRACQRQLHR